jgi:hypothetical protein
VVHTPKAGRYTVEMYAALVLEAILLALLLGA